MSIYSRIFPFARSASQRRLYSASAGGDNPHFYKTFGTPVLKVFFGALFTFQLTYWAWLKLESIEVKKQKTAELEEAQSKLLRTITDKENK